MFLSWPKWKQSVEDRFHRTAEVVERIGNDVRDSVWPEIKSLVEEVHGQKLEIGDLQESHRLLARTVGDAEGRCRNRTEQAAAELQKSLNELSGELLEMREWAKKMTAVQKLPTVPDEARIAP